MGADRLHRLRRAAGAHRAAAAPLSSTSAGGSPAEEFEDAIAACNLLPGPASTQLAIFCARRVRGAAGAVVGGLAFIVPGLVADPRALGAVPRVVAADVGPRRGRGRGRGRGGGRGARRAGTRCRPSWARAAGRGAAALVVYARRGRRGGCRRAGRGWSSCCSRAAPASSRCAGRAPRGRRPRRSCRCRSCWRAGAGGVALARLDGVQGRRALLRRRVRDHPADAGRRRRAATTG